MGGLLTATAQGTPTKCQTWKIWNWLERKKKETSKTCLDKHTEALKEGVCTQRVRNESPVFCVLIEAGLGCLLRVIGTLKELFLFASSDGPKQWLWFVGELPNSAFLAAPLTTDWVEQSCAPNSAAFCNIPVLAFLAVVTLQWHSTRAALMVSFILNKNPQTCKTQILPFPELSPLAGCRNEKWIVTHFSFPLWRWVFQAKPHHYLCVRGRFLVQLIKM